MIPLSPPSPLILSHLLKSCCDVILFKNEMHKVSEDDVSPSLPSIASYCRQRQRINRDGIDFIITLQILEMQNAEKIEMRLCSHSSFEV
jgi:hypothetical protein